MILEMILFFSLLLNVVFVLYSRYLIAQLKDISLDLAILRDVMTTYKLSLTQVYESELFYGEPTLEQLVEHTKAVSLDIDEILNQYDFEEIDTEREEREQ